MSSGGSDAFPEIHSLIADLRVSSSLDALGRAIGPTYAAAEAVVIVLSFSPLQDQQRQQHGVASL